LSETRKLAAILVADVVGYSRLAGADEDRTLARLRGLRSDLIDPAIAAHHGRIVKRTGDGSIIEFRSVVDAVRCAIEVQQGLIERNAGLPPEKRIEFRVGIHVGDVVEESDGDLMGDGVNIAARLEGIAKPGAICLSEDAYRQVSGRLEMAVTDLGPTQLKNIDKSIRAYSVEVGKPAQAKPIRGALPKKRSLLVPLAVAIAALVVIAGGAWYLVGANRIASIGLNGPASARPLSLVVLPFANLSGDPEQEYFADGVTENLTTELSRIHNAFVIARNTAMTYKGKSVDAKEIGKELGVRYVLEGSVQRDQNRVRVNAQLIDAETGAHLWADRFEDDLADLFKLQDDIVARLANPLRAELIGAEAEKATASKNPEAIDFVMRGTKLLEPPYSQDKLSEARKWFEKALNVDPNNSDAIAQKARTYVLECWWGWKSPDVDYDAMILGESDRATATDRNNIVAYDVKASYLTFLLRLNDARRVVDAGLAIDQNNSGLLVSRAIVENYSRQFDQGEADMQQVIRLSPRDPFLSHWRNLLADAELGLGQTDAAIENINKALDGGYKMWPPYLNLAAAHVLKGEIEEAKPPLAEARRLNPKISAKWIEERKPILQSAIEGLRKAGLPEE
jgi:adenylate cyclase